MLSRESITGNRIAQLYRLEGPRTRYRSSRPRENVHFRVMPRTLELLNWLAYKGWVFIGCEANPGRVIDYVSRRFFCSFCTHKVNGVRQKRKSPYKDYACQWLSTKEILDLLVDYGWGANRGRVLDFITAWAYGYEGGKMRCY